MLIAFEVATPSQILRKEVGIKEVTCKVFNRCVMLRPCSTPGRPQKSYHFV